MLRAFQNVTDDELSQYVALASAGRKHVELQAACCLNFASMLAFGCAPMI
jgi:hypothetical protein